MKTDKTKSSTPLFKLLTKVFGLIKNKKQLSSLLKQASYNGLIDGGELRIIEGTLKISAMQVREIMVPRSKMIYVQDNQTIKEFLPYLVKSAHSRFPVTNEENNVIGILLAKDLLPHLKNNNGEFKLHKVMHPAIYIPESKRLNVLLDEFRNKRLHMAIVQDEYGQTAGLVTIEDVLEEIVGEIEDEHDTRKFKNPSIIKVPFAKNNYRVKADTSLEYFNNYFATSIKKEGIDTIGGIILDNLQRMPTKGESFQLDKMTIKIIKQDKRRIEEIIVTTSI